MGRRPVPAPTRVRAFAACCLLLAALFFADASASGKKPPWAQGQGNTRDAAGETSLAAPTTASAPSLESRVVAPRKAAPGKGHGHGSGSPSSTSTSTPTSTPPPAVSTTSTSSTPVQPQPVTSAGASSSSSQHAKHRRASGHKARGHGRARRGATRGRSAKGRHSSRVASAAPPARSAHRGGHARPAPAAAPRKPTEPAQSAVIRTFEHVVQVVPTALKAVIAVLAFLVLVAAIAYFLLARTARYLARQRQALLGEIGVLQAALLPEVPDEIGGLRPSVAYRPADGPAAGGDFYDAFPLERGRVGIVIGDISGHGRDALMRTSLLRHTLRAYLDAGLEPRTALQVGGRVLDRGLDELATVILATYDPSSHLLRYASAGHPPPVFLGAPDHAPVTQGSSPPIGAGVPTGLRQTTVTVPPGSTICLFTDGLIEARRDGELIGRLGLARIISELGPEMTAEALLDRVAAKVDEVSDDMAACLFRVDGETDVPSFRSEELEVRREDAAGGVADRFLAACGLEGEEAARVADLVRETAGAFGGALLRVSIAADGACAEVLPANVENLVSGKARSAAA